ncbi:MAG TPA: adenosylmethionine decarboxylase [Sandaracinaceae bacterium LLY-WYZ-13_1]|nr:adenosylmethionine decarboxylase [Sandaracinaceae bacterium LLY-WYZ-13_1]
MDTRGRHLLVEYHGCDAVLLDDVARIEALMQHAARAANTTIVASVFQPFTPQGVSGVVVVEESHLSIHTWPEHGYAAVDFYTCGRGVPERAHESLRAGLGAQRAEIMTIERGLPGDGPGCRVSAHRDEGLEVDRTAYPILEK